MLGEMLNLLAGGVREARGARNAWRTTAPPPPALGELIAARRRSAGRTWLAYRLGIEAALANVRLQQANRFSDAYLLYQPYTFQNNAPFGRQSGMSWALGITVPLPLIQSQSGQHRAGADQRRSRRSSNWRCWSGGR